MTEQDLWDLVEKQLREEALRLINKRLPDLIDSAFSDYVEERLPDLIDSAFSDYVEEAVAKTIATLETNDTVLRIAHGQLRKRLEKKVDDQLKRARINVSVKFG